MENNNYMFQDNMNLNNIFTVKNIVLYFLIINIIGFLIMWLDKYKAKNGRWRIPEKTLFIITAMRWRNRNNCWNVCV